MKKNIFFFSFLLSIVCAVSSLAQIRYKEGYFIDRENNTVKCLIYDVDWLNNPDEVKYKLTEDGEIRTLGLSDISEFSVAGSRFVYAEVNIDTANQETKNLTSNRNPEWKRMRVLLRVLVQGKATLYSFRTPRIEKFLYSVDGSHVAQLVYKEFLVSPEHSQLINAQRTLRKNQMYLQQLKEHVVCGHVSDDELKRIAYKKDHLIRHFQAFNSCHGGDPIRRKTNRSLNIIIAPGIDFGTFSVSSPALFNRVYKTSTHPRLGVIAEYNLAFNNGKWSVMAEPTYQAHTSEDRVKYQAIELPLGIRHNFFVTENLKLFVNGFFVVDLPLKYEVRWSKNVTLTTNTSSGSFAIGGGLRSKKFSVEARQYSERKVFGGVEGFSTYFFEYSKFSLIAGYRIR